MSSLPLAPGSPLTPLDDAVRGLRHTVAGLTESDLAAPSALPGWTRGHVVAHLTLHAEGLAGALEAVAAGRDAFLYPTEASRDDDIAALAGAEPAHLARRLEAGDGRLRASLLDLDPSQQDATVARSPGSDRRFAAGQAGFMRWREVLIHHADLDAGFTHREWPDLFTLALLDSLRAQGRAEGFALHASDLDRTWQGGGPTVTGPAADLAWWLTGRGTGADLTTDDGVLPRIEAW